MFFLKMDKFEWVIKLFNLVALTTEEIDPKLAKAYGGFAPFMPTVTKWAVEFKRSKTKQKFTTSVS